MHYIVLGQWSPTPNIFNKGFFELLLFKTWTPFVNEFNKTQFTGTHYSNKNFYTLKL
jgi:catalase (peroxidase I)